MPGSGRLWWMVGPVVGMLLGVLDSVVNQVPVMLGEGGTASAERGCWSQAAEFAGLVLDAGSAWAATAVLAGWWVSRHARPAAGVLRGALAGGLALGFATTAYYGANLLFAGSAWWGVASRFWLIASVLLGPPLGVVGAAIRLPGPTGVVAALVVPAGAALQMAVLPPPAAGPMAEPVRWSIWIAAAVATALVACRFRNRSAVASSAGAAEACWAAESTATRCDECWSGVARFGRGRRGYVTLSCVPVVLYASRSARIG